jgi:hypothetical protein
MLFAVYVSVCYFLYALMCPISMYIPMQLLQLSVCHFIIQFNSIYFIHGSFYMIWDFIIMCVLKSMSAMLQLTDGQSALVSSPITFCLTVMVLSMRGALYDERMDLSFVRVSVSSNKSVVIVYIILTFYMLLNVCMDGQI